MIDRGVFVNTIAHMKHFATSKVTFWCWGMLWSLPAFGWGTFWSPPALESGSGWVGTSSDSSNVLMVDFSRLSNGGAMDPAGCRRFGSEVCAMTVSAWLCFFGTGTLVVRIVLSQQAWSRCRTSCQLSKSCSSISDDKVDSRGSSLSFSLISQSLLSSSCFIRIIARTLAISNTILEGWVGNANSWSAMKIGSLLQCMCKCSLKVGFLILLWIVIPHQAGHRFHVDDDEVKLENVDRSM